MSTQGCGGNFTTDTSVVGFCTARPCGCATALVMGCDCGFYTDPEQRKYRYHRETCSIHRKQSNE
jgi:hypothetical protein